MFLLLNRHLTLITKTSDVLVPKGSKQPKISIILRHARLQYKQYARLKYPCFAY